MPHQFEGRTVIGLAEEITILDGKNRIKLKARIDTGATRSSIDESIAKKIINAKEAGMTTVRSSHGITKRRIISIKIILGGREVEEEFTLINRKHMTYPLLVGQNILKHDFVIDPKKEEI